MSAPHRIDVHHHIVPPAYVALAGIGISNAGKERRALQPAANVASLS
ncbi:MAG: hypothetical protein QNK04_32530 [Myxococcota bacterium]|nr:hypothetical protein [Myxococcota bacterium]